MNLDEKLFEDAIEASLLSAARLPARSRAGEQLRRHPRPRPRRTLRASSKPPSPSSGNNFLRPLRRRRPARSNRLLQAARLRDRQREARSTCSATAWSTWASRSASPTSSLHTASQPTLTALYDANRLTVTRQLPYEPGSNKTLDLALLVNGIPTATAELKNHLTDQNVEHAIEQYRTDRDPKNAHARHAGRSCISRSTPTAWR